MMMDIQNHMMKIGCTSNLEFMNFTIIIITIVFWIDVVTFMNKKIE